MQRELMAAVMEVGPQPNIFCSLLVYLCFGAGNGTQGLAKCALAVSCTLEPLPGLMETRHAFFRQLFFYSVFKCSEYSKTKGFDMT